MPSPREIKQQSIRQRRSRDRALQLARRTNDASAHSMNCDRASAAAQHDLDEHRSQHPDEVAATAGEIVRFIAIVLGIPTVMVLDFLMLSAASEYLASSLSGLNASAAAVAKVVFSISIVLLEVSIAMRLAADEFEEAWKRVLQYTLALLLPLSLVALTVAAAHARWEASNGSPAATQTAPGSAGDSSVPRSEVILLYALAGLGVICHTLVIVGGRHENEAFAYLHYARRVRSIKEREHRAKRGYNRYLLRFQAVLPQYGDHLGEHNRQYAEAPIALGPFVDDTYTLADRVFPGYLPRPVPRQAAPNVAAPPEMPPAAPPAEDAAADTPAPPPVAPAAPHAGARPTEIMP
jgi:uncharacterized membrane protein YtjA (UPF0391 family)